MSNRIPLAQVDRVTNGYVIRFAEAVQQANTLLAQAAQLAKAIAGDAMK